MLAPLNHRPTPARQALHAHLMRHAAGTPNDEFLAHLIAGWTLGDGVLPPDLGLGPQRFARLMAAHFPRLAWQPQPDHGPALVLYPEFDDLVRFIGAHADTTVAGADDLTLVLATGCMGSDHLWQDLGLPSRRELSQLIALNFPELGTLNSRDMKWKKFLYRELCQREGIFVCASPSCEACADYANCFGPEE